MALSPRATHLIATQPDPASVLETAVELTREALGDCAVFAAVPEGACYRVAITSGLSDPRFGDLCIEPGRGLGGYVLDHRTPVIVEDYPHDPRISRHFVHVVSESEGLHGLICVPVFVGGHIEGLLYAGRKSVGALGGRATEQLEEAARYAAVGIQQAQERRTALELERLRDRERLAATLHDSVAQMLFGIGVAAQRSLTAGDASTLEEAMREIETTAADARRELRRTLQQLADSDPQMALEARLENQVDRFTAQTGCVVRIVRSGASRAIPDDLEELIVDTALEGLRNAVKHAAARFTLVYLEFGEQRVRVCVQSEAPPSRAPAPPVAGTGMGLAQLRRRSRNAGGTLELVPGEDNQMVLRLDIPTPG
jgi:signal transduction histidine kinase